MPIGEEPPIWASISEERWLSWVGEPLSETSKTVGGGESVLPSVSRLLLARAGEWSMVNRSETESGSG